MGRHSNDHHDRGNDPQQLEPPRKPVRGRSETVKAIGVDGHGHAIAPKNDPDWYDDLLQLNYAAPTDARPGSEEKVRLLAARYAGQVPLWHPDDRFEMSAVASKARLAVQFHPAAHRGGVSDVEEPEDVVEDGDEIPDEFDEEYAVE